jgi:uncharacterized membrane protein YfcA
VTRWGGPLPGGAAGAGAGGSLWLFVSIGVVAGFFSALFGVGGGILVVPMLILLAGFDPRVATGTSLAVIGLTALFGVFAFAALGEIDWGHAAVVGLPALAGTFAGTWLQQRVSSRALILAFAAFIVAIGIELLAE